MDLQLQQELYERFKDEPELFDFIRENALDGLWYWEFGTEEREWKDDRFYRCLGFDQENPGHERFSWFQYLHPEDLERVRDTFPKMQAGEKSSFDEILRFYHREGYTVYLRCRGAVLSAKNEEALRLLLTHQEVSELKRSEQLLAKASEAARIGFWDIDLIKGSGYWNKVTCEIHELKSDAQPSFEEAINFYVEGESRDTIQKCFNLALEQGIPYDEELQIETPNGRRKWVRSIGIPELKAGKCIRIYGLFQDIDLQVNSRMAMRSERELYRQVIEGANLGAWEWNLERDELTVNPLFARILGYELEELRRLGYSYWFDLIHPEDRPAFDQLLQACREDKAKDLSADLRLLCKNRQYIWASINAKIFNPNPFFSQPRLVGTMQDISALKSKSEVLRTFIRENPLAMAMFDSKLRYITCSKKWLSDYGLGNQELGGKSHYKVFPNIGEEWKDFHRRCLKGETLKVEEDSFEVRPGVKHWLRWEIRPWRRDDGKVGGIIMFTENITERHLIEEKLRLSEAAFRGNFENAAIGMAILDKSGRWEQVNDKTCEIFGYQREQLGRMNFTEIIHPEDVAHCEIVLGELLKGTKESFQKEKRFIRKDGSLGHMLMAMALVRDHENAPLYLISQLVDISKRKTAEKRVQALLEESEEHNERLHNFTQIVSHNLKSHASGIAKLLEYSVKHNPGTAGDEALSLAIQSSVKLNQTISDLSEILNLEGRTAETYKTLDLKDALSKAQESCKSLQPKGFIISTDLKETVQLKGIQAYLESILQNLISNALKYRDPEQAEPYLKIKDHLEQDFYVLSFEDNGMGIDLDRHRNRIFKMYQTFHEHPQAKGIGLYLLKNQLNAMGGKVEVQSELGAGTTFKIYLPYAKN